MAVYPWELSIEDGVLSAILHSILHIEDDLEIAGDLKVRHPTSNSNIRLWPDTGNNWTFGANAVSNSFFIYDNTNSANRFTIDSNGLIGMKGSTAPTIDLALSDNNTGLDLISSGVLAVMAGGLEALRFKKAGTVISSHFPEITTPVAIANFGSVYTKTDNLLYFQDGAGVEHQASPAEENYGEAYIYNNAVATVIETINTPIALRQISSGDVHGFTFDAGSSVSITSYSDYSGTVAGTVRITCTGHALTTGDIITIRGSTNYNGVFEVTVIDGDWVYITAVWAGNDGPSDIDQGASLTVGAEAAGKYPAYWQMSIAPDAACKIQVQMYINTTAQVKSTAEREFSINDLDSISSSCILTVVAGDIIWLAVQSDDVADITNKHGNFNLRKL